jgi:energy-coupling factor transport system permease protein
MPEPSEFELVGRVTIGQYLPTGSFVHRLDPRVKLCMGLLLIVSVVGTRSLIGLAVLLAAVLLGLRLARIPLRFAMSGLPPMLPFLFLLAFLQVFAIPQYTSGSTVLWRWWVLVVTSGGLLAGGLLIGRFCVLVLGISLLSFTTGTTELTHGVEHLLLPLQRFGLPAHEFALVVNIAIGFLPILTREAERLMKAQASRGAYFGSAGGGPFRRARRLLPLLIPLFLVSLRRAEELIEAMEARCYMGGKGRSHLIRLRAQPADLGDLSICLALSLLAIGLGVANADAWLWRSLALHL